MKNFLRYPSESQSANKLQNAIPVINRQFGIPFLTLFVIFPETVMFAVLTLYSYSGLSLNNGHWLLSSSSSLQM